MLVLDLFVSNGPRFSSQPLVDNLRCPSCVKIDTARRTPSCWPNIVFHGCNKRCRGSLLPIPYLVHSRDGYRTTAGWPNLGLYMRAQENLFGIPAAMDSNGAGDATPTHKAAKLFRTYAGQHPEFLILTLMLTSIPSAILILALVLTHGNITTFHSLDVRGGFRSGPEGRGTLSLVWSCISTIFTLIYVSVHLDIPNEHPVGASRNRFHAVVRSVWRPIRSNLPLIFWMLLNVFTPSLLVLVASMEYQSARDGVEFMRGFSGGRWTMRHAFFADMGGFELKGEPLLIGREFYKRVREENLHLDYDKIQEEIRDRSNKNTVLKVLTFFQASWFIAQSIVRGVEQRAISQLEVTTCAYIFSLMAAYLFWIRKPYHINGRVPLEYMLESNPGEKQHHPDDPASPPIPSLPPFTPTSPSPENLADTHTAGSQSDVERDASHSQQNPGRPPLDRKPSSWKRLSSFVLAFRRKSLPQRVELRLPGPLFQNVHFSPFNRAMYNPHKSWACELSFRDLCLLLSD